MTIRLDELAGWALMPVGEALKLAGDGREDNRRVRLNLNCEVRTWVFAEHAGASLPQFVGVVGPGCETLEFVVRGELAMNFVRAGGDGEGAAPQVWVQTSELEPNVSTNPNSVSFTEIVARRARNPELEMMQAISRQNERRMREMLDAQAAGIAKLTALYAANAKPKEKADNEAVGKVVEAGGGKVPAKDANKAGGKKGSGGGKQSAGASSEPKDDGGDSDGDV